MSMKNRKILIENDDFIRLSRSIRTAYLDGLLLLDEMWVLIWLWINANPRTGRTMASYESISKDFQSRYSKNHDLSTMVKTDLQLVHIHDMTAMK